MKLLREISSDNGQIVYDEANKHKINFTPFYPRFRAEDLSFLIETLHGVFS